MFSILAGSIVPLLVNEERADSQSGQEEKELVGMGWGKLVTKN
jgi:hypothetical protein